MHNRLSSGNTSKILFDKFTRKAPTQLISSWSRISHSFSKKRIQIFRNKSSHNKTRNSWVLVLTRFRTGSFSHCLLLCCICMCVYVLVNNSWGETASFRSIKIQWRERDTTEARTSLNDSERICMALLLLPGSRKLLLQLQNVWQVEDEKANRLISFWYIYIFKMLFLCPWTILFDRNYTSGSEIFANENKKWNF